MEPGAMQAPPRAAAARLFDWEILLRGLAQGGGLLLALFAVHVLALRQGGSDDLARAITFTVLVLSNLGLIYANRRWRAGAAPVGNRYFTWIAGAAVALLLAVLFVAPVSRLFAFVRPDAAWLLAAAAVAALNTLWFQAVKAAHHHYIERYIVRR
jgi:Ca2+-transporting ATPase